MQSWDYAALREQYGMDFFVIDRTIKVVDSSVTRENAPFESAAKGALL
ncbi:hypothetical protein QNK09_24265 [Brevibacillus agri]|nr:hypothetical protein [Brevibacillus agri]WHX30133.1 hypothetical protein QNK09_24265 [Brevibacillus agri]